MTLLILVAAGACVLAGLFTIALVMAAGRADKEAERMFGEGR